MARLLAPGDKPATARWWALAALLLPAAAGAQYWDGEAFKRTEKARKVMDDFGRCLAKGEPELSRRFVMGEPGTTEPLMNSRYASGYCLSRSTGLSYSPDAMRGPIAEYLTGRDFGGVKPLPLDRLPKLTAGRAEPRVPGQTQVVIIEYHHMLASLGDCMLRSNQVQANAVLTAKVGSAPEREAIQAMVPALQGCVPAGTRMSLDPTAVRTALAIAHYRLADAARQAGPATAPVERG